MNRKIIALILTLTMLLAVMGLMSACSQVGEVPVTAVVVEETSIFLSTSEVSNTAQIRAQVYPENATNKKVVFSYPVQNYITGTSTGEITAVRETEKGKPIEVRISAAENDKIYATIYVTVENVEAEEVVMSLPQGVAEGDGFLYLGIEPFSVVSSYVPSHASVGIELNYTSTNESVATVDSNGQVTIVGVGTAHIQAIAFSGATGYLKIIVKHTPPMYVMKVADSDVENFNQEPGVPKPIHFSLIPLGEYSDPSPTIVWSDGRKILDASKDNGLMCTYTPATNVTAGDYTVTVTITDRDDQVLVLKSDVIRIYSSLLVDGITFVNEGSYTIEYGDRINRSMEIADGQRPPEGYQWYYYVWDSGKEVDYDGSVDIYNYILSTKAKPSRSGAGDYTLIGTSTSNGDEQHYTTNLYAEGTVYLFVVPIVAGETRYDLFCGDSTPYTITESSKTEINNLHVSYAYSSGDFRPKLAWSALAGSKDYVVEIITLNADGSESGTQYYYSDNLEHSVYFVGSTFVLPSTYSQTQRFKGRVKVSGNGTAWSDYVTFDGSGRSTQLEPYYTNITSPNLGIDLYMYDMRELGSLLNALRVLRPEVSHQAGSNAYLRSVDADNASYSHKYEIGIAMPFNSVVASTGLGSDGQFETRKIVFADGRGEDNGYGEILLASKSENNELSTMSQTLSLAFASYCESGSGVFAVTNAVYGAEDKVYYVEFSFYVNADDATLTEVATNGDATYNKAIANEVVIKHTKVGATKIDYFSGNDRTIEVETSDQLYVAAQLGLKPVPKANTAAYDVYQEAVAVMDTIVSQEMSDRDRVIAIYEWLTQNVYYDHYGEKSTDIKLNDTSFRIEGALGLRKNSNLKMALCDGYAKTFVLLCWMADVPAVKVSGNAGSTGHAWNMVFVEGEWSIVDATWDSTQNAVVDSETVQLSTHKYLFRSASYIAIDHKQFGSYPATDTSTYGEHAYYIAVGAYGTKADTSDIQSNYLFGDNGVLTGLTTGQIVGVELALNVSALPNNSINEYVARLNDAMSGTKYSAISCTTLERYGTGAEETCIVKIYIKKT